MSVHMSVHMSAHMSMHRPQENQLLAVDDKVTMRLHPRIQRMMGLSIHPPFIGMADGMHPAKAFQARL